MKPERRTAVVKPLRAKRGERRRWINLKRWLLGQPISKTPLKRRPLEDPKPGRVGIACSGGGIRSAAYNLGALQVLRDKGVFGLDPDGHHQASDVLISAVSGGSYVAASFATVAAKSSSKALAPQNGGGRQRGGKRVPRRVYASGSPEEVHLRNNSSYMAPGLGGKLRLGLRVMMGMLANFLVIGIVVSLVGAALGAFYGERFGQLAHAQSTGALQSPTAAWLLPSGLVTIGAVLLLLDLIRRLRDSVRQFLEAWATRLIALGLALGVLLLAVPQVILWIRGFSWTWVLDTASTASTSNADAAGADRATSVLQLLNLSALLTAAAGALRAFVARKRSYFALAAGAVAGPLAVVAPILWVSNWTAVGGFSTGDAAVLAGLIGVAVLAWLVVDLNQWSLHPYYRRRLSSAFFVRRNARGEIEELPYDTPLRVSKIKANGRFPTLIVCAAANISDQGVTPPGRSATPFTFSHDWIGAPLVGFRGAKKYEAQAARAKRDVTLPAAVAMSGAAFSPVMGKKSVRALTFLLALTNLRLGVWLPNPKHVEELDTPRAPDWALSVPRAIEAKVGSVGRSLLEQVVPEGRKSEILDERCPNAWRRIKRWTLGRRPGPHYLFKEMLGRTKLDDRFLYVTDGGHFDNLGVVELLRRGCTTIYCLDAGGDPAGKYSALGEAIALARSELQVDIEIDPTPIDPPAKGEPPATDHVVGRIRYRATPTGTGEVTCDDDENSPWVGRIVYCRAAVTRQAPYDVRAFQDKDPRFPHHSTLDQLFDDEKFESYRALGADTADRALDTLRRRQLSDAIRAVLVARARRRATIRQCELIAEVQAALRGTAILNGELGAGERRLFRSLLDDITTAESDAQRPSLSVIVQEGIPRKSQLKAQLTQVWDYWALDLAASSNGAGGR